MSLLFLFLIITIVSYFLGIRCNKKISSTIFPATIMIILWIYIFGIFHQLKLGCISLVGISIFLLIYEVFNYKKIKKVTNISALFYLSIIFIISIVFFKNNHLINWDEFSHWGTYVKNMFYFQSLGNNSFTSIANSYPPGISIFQYFLQFLNRKYQESFLFIALYILISIVFINIFENCKKSKGKFILNCFILIVFPCCFVAANSIDSIYVDTILGIVFAYCILSIIKKEISLFHFLNLFLSTSLLILIKDSGIIFAGVIYITLLFDIFFVRKKEYIKFLKSSNLSKKIICVILLFLPIIIRGLWMIYCAKNISVSNGYDLITLSYPQYGKDVISLFLSTIFTNGIGTTGGILFLPTIYWIAISVFFILILKEKEDKTLIFAIIMCSILYCLFLIASYLFIFNKVEALKLASIGRYLVSLILGVFGISVYNALYKYNNNQINNNYFAIIIMFVVMTVGYYPFVSKVLNYNQNTTKEFYNGYNEIQQLSSKLDIDDKVYYISIESDGLDFYISKYLLTPIWTQTGNFDLYNFDNKGAISVNGFKNILLEYDYVYVHKITEKFIQDYSILFNDEIKENSLYKIEKEGLKKAVI